MLCRSSSLRKIRGARSPAAAYACTGCGSGLMILPVIGSISRPYRSRIGITIEFPHVGHCPSCPDIDSVASRRDEQYPQLNPKRRPPTRPEVPSKVLCPGRRDGPLIGGGGVGGVRGAFGADARPDAIDPATPAPAPT